MESNQARINYTSGAGGFLDPPTYPTHSISVETDLRRSPQNRGSMSLEYASTCEYIDEGTRAKAIRILTDWKRPALESDEIQDWILQVLGYFSGCYRADGPEFECWNVSNLRIIKGNHSPLPPVEEHAGVHLIRKFYPEFVPTTEHWNQAYWGNKIVKTA